MFGIIDGDGMSTDRRRERRQRGIYALDSYSLESLYYHPSIQSLAMKRFNEAIGAKAGNKLQDAAGKAFSSIPQHSERLTNRIAARTVRDRLWKGIPVNEQSLLSSPITISADGPNILAEETNSLISLLAAGDLSGIISRYPLRETQALTEIAKALGFSNRAQYESTVRAPMVESAEARKTIEECFGGMIDDLRKATFIPALTNLI